MRMAVSAAQIFSWSTDRDACSPSDVSLSLNNIVSFFDTSCVAARFLGQVDRAPDGAWRQSAERGHAMLE